MAVQQFPAPVWANELMQQYFTGNYHQFLLDGNIHDRFFWPYEELGEKGALYSVHEFLIRLLLRGIHTVVYYSSTTGPIVFSRERIQQEKGINIPSGLQEQQTSLTNIANEVERVLQQASARSVDSRASERITERVVRELFALEQTLRTRYFDRSKGEEGGKQKPKRFFLAVIVDQVDKILREVPVIYERPIAEMLERWATSEVGGNLSILITENRELLPPALRTDSAGTLPLLVEFPDADYRKIYLETVRSRCEGGLEDSYLGEYLQQEGALATLTQLTRGFRILDCQFIANICRRAKSSSSARKHFFHADEVTPDMVEQLVRQEKKDVIQSMSQGMLIPFESNLSFDGIGGLTGAKQYFIKVSHALREMVNNPALKEIVPKGVLLTGPPGTGKSLLAKALAQESGISLVKMGDIRSMWVGESERRMSLVLNLLQAMAPVIVFIDEIDQAIGQRSASSGDSGVSGRIFGKILEFMGDNDNRGKVVWIAATNRADLLDDAMIRRFDRVIPVLLPGSAKEWVAVIEGITKQIEFSEISFSSTEIENFVQANLETLRRNHSGSSMEVIVRRAYEIALQNKAEQITAQDLQTVFDNFKSNFDQRMYELQTLISVAACNELSFVVAPGEDYSYGFEGLDDVVLQAITEKTNKPIQDRIQQLLQLV
ncbi:MAG: ATP-binding protein [Methanobacteriota archaeon]|nr:MAG: ATP-binding protein [Euryarchaeota archaeon]